MSNRKRSQKEPIWTDEALSRLLGACDGYVHAILDIQSKIAEYDSQYRGRFDPRHVRKIAQRDAITEPMREIVKRLEDDLRRCQAAYEKQLSRAHPK